MEADQSLASFNSQKNLNEIENEEIGEHLDTADLENIAICFDNIRHMRRRLPGNDDYQLGQQFDQSLRQMMEQLSLDLKEAPTQEQKGRAAILAKRDLIELLSQTSRDYIKYTDVQMEKVLAEIFGQLDSMIMQACNMIQHSGARSDHESRQRDDVIANESRRVQEQQSEIQRLQTLLQRSQAKERRLQQEAQASNRKIRELESVVKSTHRASAAANNKASRTSLATGSARPQTAQTKQSKEQPISRTQPRTLTLKQLKDTISDMYTQKVKFDKKCEDSKAPRETMEQFMYTYLNQKYGLKSLIVEWAASIINGVKTYIKSDHDVTLFAKILKNECDEEFRFIQMHVKDTLLQLVKVILKDKYPQKSEPDVQRMLDGITGGRIDDWIWQKILDKMYEESDAL